MYNSLQFTEHSQKKNDFTPPVSTSLKTVTLIIISQIAPVVLPPDMSCQLDIPGLQSNPPGMDSQEVGIL